MRKSVVNQNPELMWKERSSRIVVHSALMGPSPLCENFPKIQLGIRTNSTDKLNQNSRDESQKSVYYFCDPAKHSTAEELTCELNTESAVENLL